MARWELSEDDKHEVVTGFSRGWDTGMVINSIYDKYPERHSESYRSDYLAIRDAISTYNPHCARCTKARKAKYIEFWEERRKGLITSLLRLDEKFMVGIETAVDNITRIDENYRYTTHHPALLLREKTLNEIYSRYDKLKKSILLLSTVAEAQHADVVLGKDDSPKPFSTPVETSRQLGDAHNVYGNGAGHPTSAD